MAKIESVDIDGIHRQHFLMALNTAPLLGESAEGPIIVYGENAYSAQQVTIAAARHAGLISARDPVPSKARDVAMTRRLRQCGFTVISQVDRSGADLRSVVLEILDLQREWVSTNTPAMERRGQLVRNILPQVLRSQARHIEASFSPFAYSMEAEGSDGVGRKVASPWTRVYDAEMSPSATSGWYIVLHFERTGQAMYVTLGCGATKFINGEFIPVAPALLAKQVDWARGVAKTSAFPTTEFSDPINLHGNALSSQFESATAFAKRISRSHFTEERFWDAIGLLSRLLVRIYEEERKGRAPLSEPPEVESALIEIVKAVDPKARRNSGQGRGLSPAERIAVEMRAMAIAEETLREQGFLDIVDVSRIQCFDLAATRDGVRWCVEVKGTTSPTADAILMTAAEVALHRDKRGSTILLLVAGVELIRSGEAVEAIGGHPELLAPWDCDLWEFEPTVFRARRTRP